MLFLKKYSNRQDVLIHKLLISKPEVVKNGALFPL